MLYYFANATNSKQKDVQMDFSVSTFQFEIQISHFLRVDQ